MTSFVRAPEAARRLGVSTATLYSYVSRGRVHRTIGADGRSSLFDLEELEALREKNCRPLPPPPTIDVRIASAVTQLDEDGLRYRDVPVDELVDQPYEQVCALLWRTLPPELKPARLPATASETSEGVMGLVQLVAGLQLPDDPFAAADIVLGTIPVALGGASDQALPYADRLAHAWIPHPSIELVRAINSTLVLLADHELATSTLAVRVAASVRSSPRAAFIAGLAAVDGDLHGSASHHAHRLLLDCEREGADHVLDRLRAERRRVPGFGHSIYRSRDPRFGLLLDRVQALPDPNGRLDTVASLLAVAGRYVAQAPNIDLALGALTFVAGLPGDCPVFAIARIAGWAAHYNEEVDERPLRFRGLSY
jgi:citrate synthase